MYTDKTIPAKCAECDVVEEGADNMMKHILTDHPGYTPQEAIEYAQKWIEDAYPEREAEMAAYYEGRKLDKAVDADAFPNK